MRLEEIKTLKRTADSAEADDVQLEAIATAFESSNAADAEASAQRHEAEAFQRQLRAEAAGSHSGSFETPQLPDGTSRLNEGDFQFDVMDNKQKLRVLLPGAIVSVAYGTKPDGTALFYLALVCERKASTGPQSIRIHWLDELPDDTNVYRLSELKPWHRPEDRGVKSVLGFPRVQRVEKEPPRWRLVEPTASPQPEPKPQPQPSQPPPVPKPSEAAASSQPPPPPPASVLPPPAEKPKPKPLKGRAGLASGSSGFLSNNAREWLNDSQIFNAIVLMLGGEAMVWDDELYRAWMQLPAGARLRVNYPRPEAGFVLAVMQRKTVRLMLEGKRASDYVVAPFCGGKHWHVLLLHGPEKVVYYFEAKYGSKLTARHAIRMEMARHASAGWKLVDVGAIFQLDDYQCGVWVHAATECFIEYVTSGATGGFRDFLCSRPLFQPLVGRKANAANDAYIVGVRDRMREALEAAAVAGDLPFANAQLAEFAEGGEAEKGVIDLDSEDDEQEGAED